MMGYALANPSYEIGDRTRETLEQDPDRLELLSGFRIRNPQIEAIAMMLLTELQQEHSGSRL